MSILTFCIHTLFLFLLFFFMFSVEEITMVSGCLGDVKETFIKILNSSVTMLNFCSMIILNE